jgi:hypothetical protein
MWLPGSGASLADGGQRCDTYNDAIGGMTVSRIQSSLTPRVIYTLRGIMLRSIASTRKNPVKLGGACRSTSTRLAHTPPAHGPPFFASLRAPSAVRHTVYNGIRGFSTTRPVSAIIPFKLHDIGEGITEVEMLKWKVTEGQRVDHFDDLCEVQSDKST